MSLFHKIINGCVGFMQKYLPEPFIFAIILTFVAVLVAIPVCHQSIAEVVNELVKDTNNVTILNMFVPSGGGHWAIQAPIMFAAGEALNVDHGLTGMAIAKLNAKDIMGFCLIDLVVSGIIIIGGLLIWAI